MEWVALMLNTFEALTYWTL